MLRKLKAYASAVSVAVVVFLLLWYLGIVIAIYLMKVHLVFKLLGIPAFGIALYFSVNLGKRIFDKLEMEPDEEPDAKLEGSSLP